MNSAEIDSLFQSARSYERSHMGVRYGRDFAEYAALLLESTEFKGLCRAQVAMGLMNVLILNREKAESDPSSLLDDMAASPLRDGLAFACYVGYKLGQRSSEVTALEKLAEKSS